MSRNTLTALSVTAGMILATASSAYLGIYKYPPGINHPNGQVERYTSGLVRYCMKERVIQAFADGNDRTRWPLCRAEFEATSTLGQFNLRAHSLSVSAIALFGSVLWLGFARKQDRARSKIKSGRLYLKGRKGQAALKAALYQEARLSGSARKFPKGMHYPWDRENRHMMIWGGVGSGKTQIMLNLMQAVHARGDKMVILDTKGDMTRGFARHQTLLAPQDARSVVWQIAKDCTGRLDARELAAKLIPESHDRIWSDAARAVLTACLIKLQSEQPGEWGWADLRRAATQSSEKLRETAAHYYPEALHVLGEEDSKTTQSVLTTLQAHLHTVSALSDAWPTSSVDGLSLTSWLNDPYQSPPLILQYDGRYPDFSNAWIGAFIATLSSIIASPAFEEDPNRRIWLFLDEFPQLNRMAHFSTLLDTGRSKGVCVVLGLQDIAQLRDRYGRDQADAWISMVGTHIITRMTLGRTAEEVCRLISTQKVEAQSLNRTYSRGDVSVNEGTRLETKEVITVDELQSRLGPKKRGIRALMLGPGKDVYEFMVPYVTLPNYRPASQPKTADPPASERPVDRKPASLLSPDAVRKIRDRGAG